ncbi:MAG: TrkH family potassium uptake protein, partial [Halanaerobiales bacterium]
MRYKEILKKKYNYIFQYTGMILMFVGGSILIPILVILSNPSEVVYIKYFLYASLLAFSFGGFLYLFFSEKGSEFTLGLKEGGIIVTLSWIFTIVFSALPFIWGMNMNWTNAIFESVSGWTTTGLSVVNVDKAPRIYLFWRSLMQMFGGAGLAVIALSSLLPMQGLGLYNAEARSDKLLPHVKRSTSMIMQIYIGYTIAGTLLYQLAGMSFFSAINHSMAAISTGGFSTVGASIGHWDNLMVELVTIVLMILGTINFATHYTLIQGKVKKFFQNAEIKFMIILFAISIPVVIFISLNSIYSSINESFRITSFNLISALSTTGFDTVDFNHWPDFSYLIVVILMIIGGGTGSTAGGIKQYRIYIMLKSII